jgi:hypothetical protein
VTAEIVAQVYYKALHDATGLAGPSRLVQANPSGRSAARAVPVRAIGQTASSAVAAAERVVRRGATPAAARYGGVLWRKHGSVLRASGLGFTAFVRGLGERMHVATRLMRPGEVRTRLLTLRFPASEDPAWRPPILIRRHLIALVRHRCNEQGSS